MNIEIRSNIKEFAELNEGDVFLFQDECFLVIPDVTDCAHEINAINLYTGCCEFFESYVNVRPVKAHLIITE